ncbi:hypothetical protein H0H93_002959 [Arthromyces matolae]|nr:hypothetical protein H0H93_002959 [Arthromyces matolae]
MAGLLEWSNAIRFSMVNDPGREIFQAQLNTHGFIFLDDYLENILLGPSQDPIIELVKTPGRKKAALKRPKGLTLSKLQPITTVEEEEEMKENFPPLNAFHEALLKTKNQSTTSIVHLPSSAHSEGSKGSLVANSAENLAIQNHGLVAGSSSTDRLAPPRTKPNDLSVIAEDDESFEPNSLPRKTSDPPVISHLSPIVETHTSSKYQGPRTPIQESEPIVESSSDVFHSINLSSPTQFGVVNGQPLSTSSSHATLENNHEVQERATQPNHPMQPSPLDGKSATEPDIVFQSTATQDAETISRNQSQAQTAAEKFVVASFPALPAPIPLRKSVRAPRDPSGAIGSAAATTPAPPGAKRTSWLKKAREVKALEVPVKPAATHLPPAAAPRSNMLKRKSVGLDTPNLESHERHSKSAKSDDGDEAPLKATQTEAEHKTRPASPPQPNNDEPLGQQGMLDRFRKTVEDLGSRVGKSFNKSLGAAAATSALAEARAAAEARVAERNHQEEETSRNTSLTNAATSGSPLADKTGSSANNPSEQQLVEERRLSISDLFPPVNSPMKIKNKSPARIRPVISESSKSSGIDPNQHANPGRESISTTPPHSPPFLLGNHSILSLDTVADKPPAVFVPPATVSGHSHRDNGNGLPSFPAFPLPPSMALGLGSRYQLPASPQHAEPLSRQTTSESIESDKIFDETETWMPETQDTQHSLSYVTQTQNSLQPTLDEDDSWPLDVKPGADTRWIFGDNIKEDSMTWSTLPSESQRGDTNSHLSQPHNEEQRMKDLDPIAVPPLASTVNIISIAADDSDLQDIVNHGKSGSISKAADSQASMSSSQSSQSHTGFLGQASRFLGSALGTSKKGTSDVKKVLQMAAVAAKKQQEENDKKAARLKEMENRRQLAIQRKAEEEKARSLEQERKAKEEGDRRKREREENTDRRPIKVITMKKDDELAKKRKIAAPDVEKKEVKKGPPKLVPKPASSKLGSALGSSTAFNVSLHNAAGSSTTEPKPLKIINTVSSVQKGKAATHAPNAVDDESLQPSQVLQTQMAARAKAQIQAARLATEPPVPSESIELPDIQSEYSDSEDEDRANGFPDWAQSPELRQALQLQSTINPDEIFGAIRPLRMEEMFKNRTSRFRARTSSANWTGSDRLTMEEEREYAKRMGFR